MLPHNFRLLLCVLCAFVVNVPAAQAQTRIRLGTQAPKGSSVHQSLQAMAERVRQASGGSVTFTIYAGGDMGGESEMVSRMRVGQLQAATLSVVGLAEIDDSVKALQEMPMMFRSLEEVDYVRAKLAPDLTRRFYEKGFVVTNWADVGWVRFFSKQPLIHFADCKKAKMFAWASDHAQIDLLKSMGYNVVPLEVNDILPGLQTGLIDTVAAIPFYALAGQIYRPAGNMLEVPWAPLVGATVITRKAWDALPPAVQEAFRKAAQQAGEEIKTRSRAESEQAVEAMKKRGLIVHRLTPEIEAEWRKGAEEVYPKIRGRMVPVDKFDEVRRLLEEYRRANGGGKQ